jgi:acyl-[acyl-carrier-protein]-phospholipid O-acyltransferase/long-chain-fatty-acid--[acyl-carrier-protein] ligase
MMHVAGSDSPSLIPEEHKVGILSGSFMGLLVTQFLGVFNDNLFKWFATYYGVSLLGDEYKATVLATGSALFVLPYVLFAAPAGFLADRFGKPRVIAATKFLEVIIMCLAVLGILMKSPYIILFCIFLLGVQACLFGPAKLGILPELLRTDRLPTANGLASLATMSAILLGTVAGLAIRDITSNANIPDAIRGDLVPVHLAGIEIPGLWFVGSILLGIAGIGYVCSLAIRPIPAAAPGRKLPLNFFAETWHDVQVMCEDKSMRRVAFGAAYFWALGCLAQLTVNLYAEAHLGINPLINSRPIGYLMVSLAVGVSVGSVLAGIWSRGQVELGMVPIASAGLVLFAGLLFFSYESYYWTATWLFFLGLSGGLYDVPLMAFLQKNSPAEKRGQVFAGNNFITFLGMLVVTGLFSLLEALKVSPRGIFLIAAIATIPITIYIFRLVPDYTLRFIAWAASHLIYKVKVYGRDRVPETGGVLLVCNHVSFADGALLGIYTPRHVRMIAYDGNLKGRIMGWMSRTMRTIPINASGGPKALIESLRAANQAIKDGDVVCIFAEGGITRTGQLLAFQRGLLKIIEGTNAPVIPVYLDGMWGSIFSFEGGRFFKKYPKSWPYRVSVCYGEPIYDPKTTFEVRQAVEALGAEAVMNRRAASLSLPRRMIRGCRRMWGLSKIADSTGSNLTGREVLLKSLVVRSILSRLLAGNEKTVGVLLPPSVGGALVNAALAMLGRTTVNLNYTISANDLNSHLRLAEVKHVVTSRKFQEKVHLDLDTEFLYLEDFAEKATPGDKYVAAFYTYCVPSFVLDRLLGLMRIKPNDTATIIFTSGSTGDPKGVMLSQFNLTSNIEAVDQLLHLNTNDVMLGALPFFHSFGYTITLWSILSLNAKAIYHFNPLDARTIGQLCDEHKVTVLVATPTFIRTYMKRIEKEQFKALDIVITGAEKLPQDLAQAFFEKYGVQINEGYGTTELTPLTAVNVPDHREETFTQVGHKAGTVGRPIPGVTAKVVDPETGQALGPDTPGLLLIKGPNVMQGYLKMPEKTAEVIKDGWYVTGDFAQIDNEGFITITGRQSRFSKIGGEMVPHIKIEEVLTKILAEPTDDGPELRAVVTAVPDERKGERLVVIHKKMSKTTQEVCQALSDAGLPNLWIPASDSFIEVEEIPFLGTGKLDLKGLKTLATAKFAV